MIKGSTMASGQESHNKYKLACMHMLASVHDMYSYHCNMHTHTHAPGATTIALHSHKHYDDSKWQHAAHVSVKHQLDS